MPKLELSRAETSLLRTVADLGQDGQVFIHKNMRADERGTMERLMFKGLVELKPLIQFASPPRRPIVLTPKGKAIVERDVQQGLWMWGEAA